MSCCSIFLFHFGANSASRYIHNGARYRLEVAKIRGSEFQNPCITTLFRNFGRWLLFTEHPTKICRCPFESWSAIFGFAVKEAGSSSLGFVARVEGFRYFIGVVLCFKSIRMNNMELGMVNIALVSLALPCQAFSPRHSWLYGIQQNC